MTYRFMVCLLACVALLAACASPPTKALEDAEKALREAAVVSECAPEEFQAAEERLAMAKRLVEAGDYDAAEVQAKAAKQLAMQAKKAGERDWDECQKAKGPKGPTAEELAAANAPPDVSTLQTIYFDYNESILSDKSQAALQSNAEWMRRYKDIKITIQGHCDERGSTEYNVALGERRAFAVRNYLIQLGIEGANLTVLSFGEEKPMSFGQDETSHARNRRAEFVERK